MTQRSSATRDMAALEDRSVERFAARARAVRWARARPALVGVAVAVVAAAGAWLVFASSVLAVHSVTVVGADEATAAQIRQLAQSVVGDPMLTADLGSLRHRIAAVPVVQDVDVSRSWPRGVRIHVVERTPVAAVPSAGEWQLIDRSGVPFHTVSERPDGLLVVRVQTPGAADPATHAALSVIRSLPARVRRQLVRVTALSEDGVRLKLQHGVTVIWGGPAGSARKGEALAALLHRHAAVYDVSTPGMVTTRS